MGRSPRHLAPGTLWELTTRCSEERFFLRPDPELTNAVGYWLARAQAAHPQVVLHAVTIMSDHLHVLGRDDGSQLSAFMAYFLGNLAKAVNVIRDRRGAVFGRRFTSLCVLDTEAAAERLVYLVTNPVTAGLVARHDRWPGLLLWCREGRPVSRSFMAPPRQVAERAGGAPRELLAVTVQPLVLPIEPNDSGVRVRPAVLRGMPPTAEPRAPGEVDATPAALVLDDMGTSDAASIATAHHLLERVQARENELAAERCAHGSAVAGIKRVLATPPESRPAEPKRTPRPLCHTTSTELLRLFRRAWRALCVWYGEASATLRAGLPGRPFPPFTFRPALGLYSEPSAAG